MSDLTDFEKSCDPRVKAIAIALREQIEDLTLAQVADLQHILVGLAQELLEDLPDD